MTAIVAFNGGPLDGVRSTADTIELEIPDNGGKYVIHHRVEVPADQREPDDPSERVTYGWELA